ncbi:exosome 3'-_5 exonuclease subunit ski4 (Csl4) [Entophlyctis sp. JEL0112]|nr:exosome 3'->5 exonuclease subunit ski4 (Csl4) [Entophlyctis sp. JEL0112]
MLVVPGARLGLVGEYVASQGTVVVGDHILAAIVGEVQRSKSLQDSEPDIIRVVSRKKKNLKASVPEIVSVVTGKVISVNPRRAVIMIMIVGDKPCSDSFQGIIRVQDVRATEKDKVTIYNSFRPGDIVRQAQSS